MLKVNICTISFRHCLVSLEDIIDFAFKNGFWGIELWEPHVYGLIENENRLNEMKEKLSNLDVHFSMISTYMDFYVNKFDFQHQIKRINTIILPCIIDE